MSKKPLVAIVMGSESDLPIMQEVARILKEFNVPYEMTVSSAHRSPERTAEYVRQATEKGVEVIIAGAGGAAHLPGVMAAHTILPVIGVPIESNLLGLDSLLSIVQMPAGVPVATMAIGKAGARNAGVLAAQILAGKHEWLKEKLIKFKESLKDKVIEQAKKLSEDATGGET